MVLCGTLASSACGEFSEGQARRRRSWAGSPAKRGRAAGRTAGRAAGRAARLAGLAAFSAAAPPAAPPRHLLCCWHQSRQRLRRCRKRWCLWAREAATGVRDPQQPTDHLGVARVPGLEPWRSALLLTCGALRRQRHVWTAKGLGHIPDLWPADTRHVTCQRGSSGEEGPLRRRPRGPLRRRRSCPSSPASLPLVAGEPAPRGQPARPAAAPPAYPASLPRRAKY